TDGTHSRENAANTCRVRRMLCAKRLPCERNRPGSRIAAPATYMERRGRILVVDDEANARAALVELLREDGYAVETAADGFKALPKLDEFAPHILLTDLKMPGLDGIELMRKGRERDPELTVVMMTAFGAVDSAVTAMRAGAVDYLT